MEFAAADVFRKDFHKEAFKFCPIEFKCREDGPKALGIVLGSLILIGLGVERLCDSP